MEQILVTFEGEIPAQEFRYSAVIMTTTTTPAVSFVTLQILLI